MESLIGGVSGTRAAVNVPVGSGQHNFSSLSLIAGIYATGWDGTVIVDADSSGHVEVLP